MTRVFDTIVRINNISVGNTHTPLFLPDIGTFFNKDWKTALEIIDTLANAGAKCIKGEVLHDPNVCHVAATDLSYLGGSGKRLTENYRDLIERKCLSLDVYKTILEHIHNTGLPIVMSVYDKIGAEFCAENGVSALKIASSNVTNLRLIRAVADTGLPVILDTGHSTMAEIARAVEAISKTANSQLILQHSPYPPPNPISGQNIRALLTLQAVYGVPVGLSDHHAGEEMLFAAVALGAACIEKGITISKCQEDQDVYHALAIGDFGRVLKSCDIIFSGLGNGKLRLEAQEKLSRVGLYTSPTGATSGQRVSDVVVEAFPCNSISAAHYELIKNWKLNKNLPPSTHVSWSDLTPVDE